MPAPADGVALNTIVRWGQPKRYLRITSGPQRGRYVHQLVAEAMLGRPLAPGEEVDHDNQNTLDNAWTNLKVLMKSEHTRVTNRRRKKACA